jgi:putative hemolysin
LLTSTEFLLDILKIRPSSDGKITEEEIKAIIKQGTETDQEIEQDIVERVFYIGDRKINSLMTHRKSVVYLPLHSNKRLRSLCVMNCIRFTRCITVTMMILLVVNLKNILH